MSDIALAASAVSSQAAGTKAAQLLTRRGALLMKEIRPIGSMRDLYGAKLEVKTSLLTIAKSSASPEETSFSVRLEYSKDRQESAALIDFDELDEIDKALVFIEKSAAKIAGQRRDYTELIYSTKDSLQFGFYHDTSASQMFFLKTDPRSHIFLEVESIPKLRELLTNARSHLISKGASH